MAIRGLLSVAWVASCVFAGCAPASTSNNKQGTFNASAREAAADQECSIVGTTLEAATGDVLANVEIKGPNGAHAVSDKNGRFALEDLPPGTTGEVEGLARDGRKARATLRPLAPGRLEIVLYLK
jgi:hypothetical protein